MEKFDTDGLQTSVTTEEPSDQKHSSGGGMARRQFLAAAAVTAGVTASSDVTAAIESGSIEDSVERKTSRVWEEHLIPARNALISDPVDVEAAKDELYEAVQQLEALEVDDEN